MSAPLAARAAGRRIGWKPFAYDDAIPSVRLRARMPSDALARAGFRTGIVPPDGRGDYDCVVFQKCFHERDIELAERLRARGVKVILDLCDDYLYNPDGDPRLAERADRVRRMIATADLVTVSTPALASVVPGRTVVVDDGLEVPSLGVTGRLTRFRARHLRGRRPRTRLVWFGSSGSDKPEFGLIDLGRVMPALEEVNRTRPVDLTVISDSRERFDEHVGGSALPSRFVPWRARTFARTFVRHDICILPITPNPYTVCKTSNRLRTALGLGVPVVTSSIPSYEEFADWVLFEDWEASIAAYAEHPDLALRHVEGAREHITRTYTPARLVEQWCAAIDAAFE